MVKEYLGYLAWFSVPESCEISQNEYVTNILKNGAPIPLARPPRPDNVFKRACNEAAFKIKTPEFTKHFFTSKSTYSGQQIARQILCEITTHGAPKQFPIGQITFNKETFKTNVNMWSSTEEDMFKIVVKNINDYLDEKSLILNALTVRETIRRTLERSLKAICIRGGLYFVTLNHEADLLSTESTINMIPEASFHTVALENLPKHRTMLIEAGAKHFAETAGALSAELSPYIEHKHISAKKFLQFTAAQDELAAQYKEHCEALGKIDAEPIATLASDIQHILELTTKDPK